MFIDELKCIRILLNNLLSNSKVSKESEFEFNDEDTFRKIKNNLFSLISMNNLINHFILNPTFKVDDLFNDEMLKTNVIPPTIHFCNSKSKKEILEMIIEALKDHNFVFDEANDIYISTEKLEATITPAWLYYVSTKYQREEYEKVYFYNKSRPLNINSYEHLLSYLKHSKTFLVKLHTDNPDVSLDKVFNKAKKETDKQMRKESDVSILDIASEFRKNIDDSYEPHLSSLRLNKAYWIIEEIKKLDIDFFTLGIEEQESIINNLIIKHLKTNEESLARTQRHIISLGTLNSEDLTKEDTRKVISGLFMLFINLLQIETYDLSEISLLGLNIDTYIPESIEKDYLKNKFICELTDMKEKEQCSLAIEAEQITNEIKDLDIIKDFERIAKLREQYQELINKSERATQIIDEYKEYQQGLKKPTKENIDDAIVGLAFDTNNIIKLIKAAINEGEVYVTSSNITIELHKPNIPKPIFKATLPISAFIDFETTIIDDLDETYSYAA